MEKRFNHIGRLIMQLLNLLHVSRPLNPTSTGVPKGLPQGDFKTHIVNTTNLFNLLPVVASGLT